MFSQLAKKLGHCRLGVLISGLESVDVEFVLCRQIKGVWVLCFCFIWSMVGAVMVVRDL